MKAFLFLLFIAAGATAAAQQPDAELNKLFEKNKGLLQKVDVRTRVLQPGRATATAPNLYRLPQDGMPCIVPDTRAIAAMPNALPELKTPDVAAIPNPAFKTEIVKSKIIRGPSSR